MAKSEGLLHQSIDCIAGIPQLEMDPIASAQDVALLELSKATNNPSCKLPQVSTDQSSSWQAGQWLALSLSMRMQDGIPTISSTSAHRGRRLISGSYIKCIPEQYESNALGKDIYCQTYMSGLGAK